MGFGTYDRAVHPRVGVLLDGLAAHGAEVVEVVRPLGIDTAGRVDLLRRPWRVPLLAVRVLSCWTSIAGRGLRTARRLDPDVVLVGYLGHFDVLLARLLFPRRTIVLDHLISAADTATDRGAHGDLLQRLLGGLDRAAVSAADVVVVDTTAQARQVGGRDPRDVVVVPVGADERWVAAAAGGHEPDPPEPLRVVFFGLFTPLHGTATIARAIALLCARQEPVELLMIGTGQDHEQALELAGGSSRVTWRPWVEPADLPGVVAAHDVCLGIFGSTDKALRVVPSKAYQGAAAGCAIVTSDTPPQRDALGDAAVFVPPGDPEALADALTALAHDRHELARRREAARTLAVTCFVPAAVVEPLLDRLDAPVPALAAGSDARGRPTL